MAYFLLQNFFVLVHKLFLVSLLPSFLHLSIQSTYIPLLYFALMHIANHIIFSTVLQQDNIPAQISINIKTYKLFLISHVAHES